MRIFSPSWQDTSRNLSKVDQMLGEYRDHTDDQAQAMTLVREPIVQSHSLPVKSLGVPASFMSFLLSTL